MVKNNIDTLLDMMDKDFDLVHEILDKKKLTLDDEYNKTNHTYYIMFCYHYESFHILIQNNYFSSAILLMRTMLELYVKSYYLEFIEKEKQTSILDFLDDKKDFPSFFNMTQKLEEHTDVSGAKFDGVFKQFTKSGLASYEKFSLFSHGKGEYLKATFEHKKITPTNQQVTDILKTAKGLFRTLSLLLMYVQGFNDEVKLLVNRFQEEQS